MYVLYTTSAYIYIYIYIYILCVTAIDIYAGNPIVAEYVFGMFISQLYTLLYILILWVITVYSTVFGGLYSSPHTFLEKSPRHYTKMYGTLRSFSSYIIGLHSICTVLELSIA